MGLDAPECLRSSTCCDRGQRADGQIGENRAGEAADSQSGRWTQSSWVGATRWEKLRMREPSEGRMAMKNNRGAGKRGGCWRWEKEGEGWKRTRWAMRTGDGDGCVFLGLGQFYYFAAGERENRGPGRLQESSRKFNMEGKANYNTRGGGQAGSAEGDETSEQNHGGHGPWGWGMGDWGITNNPRGHNPRGHDGAPQKGNWEWAPWMGTGRTSLQGPSVCGQWCCVHHPSSSTPRPVDVPAGRVCHGESGWSTRQVPSTEHTAGRWKAKR